MFSQIKLALLGLGALAVVTAIGLGYMHYRNVLSERDAALAERDRAVISQAAAEASARLYRERSERLSAAVQEASTRAIAAEDQVHQLQDKLDHDIARLASRHPGMVERRFNRGTLDTLRMLEAASRPGGGDGTIAPANSSP